VDGDGRLWLSSDTGIARFDPADQSVRSYGTDHGLQAWDFNFGGHYKSPDGQLFFGGVNGFNAFTGFLSTPESAEVDDLFRMVREEPGRLADEGRLEIRTSVPPSVELVF
jgi:streptogramin lyase